MSGYSKSRIVGIDQDQLDEFTCGICQDVFNNPVVTRSCGHSYCKDCIEEWLRGHNSCPNDRKTLTIDGLTEVPRFVNNFINKLLIKCEFDGNGCESAVTIGQIKDHSKGCEYRKCKTCNLNWDNTEHNCLTPLIEENNRLKANYSKSLKEVEKLKEVNEDQLKELSKLKKDLEAVKQLNYRLQNHYYTLKNNGSGNEDIDKLKAKHLEEMSEIKKKHEWCAVCQNESIYYCCWNTSYCSVECQQQHWHIEHNKNCRRASRAAKRKR